MKSGYGRVSWALVDHNDNDIGAPAKSGSIIGDGSLSYDSIRKYLRSYKIDTVYYNSTYVINYFNFGSSWVGFDDVEAIRAKVAYAKEKGLLGYNAAGRIPKPEKPPPHPPTTGNLLRSLCKEFVGDYLASNRFSYTATRLHNLLSKKKSDYSKSERDDEQEANLRSNHQVISFADISEVTNCFLEENKLGEDPRRRSMLNWEKWVEIIEGIIQGLLYLQEYSRLTIVHRDLKASNILLATHMKPRISDFGIAKSFQDNETEASTDRIVGTLFRLNMIRLGLNNISGADAALKTCVLFPLKLFLSISKGYNLEQLDMEGGRSPVMVEEVLGSDGGGEAVFGSDGGGEAWWWW
ncbi:chitinase II [Tanacetum coccineum]